MMRIPMSSAGSGLFRALLARSGVSRDRILLTQYRSIDWQSLTFVGERHRLALRVLGPDAQAAVLRLTEGLADAEFSIPGHFVADIELQGQLEINDDASVELELEALTIAD